MLEDSHLTRTKPLRVLFTGYAHVHYICFRPLHEFLAARPDAEVSVSGGLRTKTEDGYIYDEQAMYRPFDLPADRVLPVEEIRRRDFDVIFAGNTKMILPRSVATRIQIFHGLSFRNKAVRPANMGCDHYFLVGPYMRRRFSEAGLLAEDDPRAVPVGFMKTDRLLNGEIERSRLLAEYDLRGDRPIVLYAPTGARKNSLEIMGEDVIERLVAMDRYDLLVKPHDHPKNKSIDWFERLERFEGEHCRTMREPDVIKLLFLADLLISDASSVASEYSLLDRPMVFLDTPELIAEAQTAEHSMTDLDTWGRKGGEVVGRPDDVARAVDHGLAHPQALSKVRRAMARDLFYNPGQATKAAISWLSERLLDRPNSVAA